MDTAAIMQMPSIDDVSFETLMRDPYPVYERARRMGGIVHIASANIPLVVGFDDIIAIERDPAVFSSAIPQSNVVRLFGPNLMRKDGEEHRSERKAVDPGLRPGAASRCWGARLETIVTEVLDDVAPAGAADLFGAVAEPIAGRALAAVLGLDDVDWLTIARWSQAMMDGSGNYSGDPDITRRALDTGREIEEAVDRALARPGGPPEHSVLASMQAGGLDRGQIYGNAKVAVGGGFNEPRDALLSLTYALLTSPDQLDLLRQDEALWPTAFEEAVRWVSPIGMYPRRTTRETAIGGVVLPAGMQIGLSVAAANRDPARFANADAFDLRRPRQQHLAFGSGPHFCAGTWVARMLIGKLAAPALFRRLNGLALDDPAGVAFRGWVFRGPTCLNARWDPG